MGFEGFRTRVAARVLALFFVGAIVPVLALQLLSARAVGNLLEEQSEERLGHLADATAQVILERLASTTSTARTAGQIALGAGGDLGVIEDAGLAPGLAGLMLDGATGRRGVVGDLEGIPELTAEEAWRLAEGEALIKATHADGEETRIHLAIPLGPASETTLWARLEADSLWSAAMTLASGARESDACVLNSDYVPMVCRAGPASRLGTEIRRIRPTGVGGALEVDLAGTAHIAAWRRVYLRASYGAPDWLVVVSEDAESVHAPAAVFSYNLPLVLAIGLGLVLLLANVLVRRTMEPLNALMVGTAGITRHDLSTRVQVTTDDEFGELGRSFNAMAKELSAQFGQIEAAQAVDRAVIEDNSSTRAVAALLDGLDTVLGDAKAAVILTEEVGDDIAGLYFRDGSDRLARRGLSQEQFAELDSGGDWSEQELLGPSVPAFLHGSGWIPAGHGVFLVRMRVQRTDVGFVAVPLVRAQRGFVEEERAKRLVARAAVALNENRLRRELVEFGGETLRALANTIDAKSKWTTGHSERVTDLSWAIGRQLELRPAELDVLHRGGLLHDIGKIGIATEILDWPGRLDDAQRKAIEAHPVIGARILEPIKIFRPLLPIVVHHHERWDGRGYPHGLRGSEIPYLARVLTVADVFDALVSPRPYRSAMPLEQAMSIMNEECGALFDPEVFEAFEQVLEGGWRHCTTARGVPADG